MSLLAHKMLSKCQPAAETVGEACCEGNTDGVYQRLPVTVSEHDEDGSIERSVPMLEMSASPTASAQRLNVHKQHAGCSGHCRQE